MNVLKSNKYKYHDINNYLMDVMKNEENKMRLDKMAEKFLAEWNWNTAGVPLNLLE